MYRKNNKLIKNILKRIFIIIIVIKFLMIKVIFKTQMTQILIRVPIKNR